MEAEIKVLIVDDHPMFRQGLRDLLDTEPGLTLVGETPTGEEALVQAGQLRPDVILMDINLPGMNGLQVARQIKEDRPGIAIIMITGYDEPEQLFHAFRAGASAYCAKDVNPGDLVELIRSAHAGYYIVDGEPLEYEQLVAWIEEKVGSMDGVLPGDEGLYEPLTDRQMEVLELLTRGMSNREIAVKLDISHQTVKNHITAILRKLNCQDRTQAAVYALSHGWIRLDTQPGRV